MCSTRDLTVTYEDSIVTCWEERGGRCEAAVTSGRRNANYHYN